MRDHFGFEVSEGPHHLDRHVHKFLSDIITHPPAQASGAVTEAMVEAAKVSLDAMWAWGWDRAPLDSCRRRAFDKTTAALAQGGGNER